MVNIDRTLLLIAVVLLAVSVCDTNREPKPVNQTTENTVVNSPCTRFPASASKSTLNESDNPLLVRSASGIPRHAPSNNDSHRDPLSSFVTILTLRITGLKRQNSNLYIAVFTSATGFPKVDRCAATQVIAVDDTIATHEFAIENEGTVAIAIFQDLDGNGILSKNAFGIPIEPYGFSNNARGLMGPPSFQDAAIRVSQAAETRDIRLL